MKYFRRKTTPKKKYIYTVAASVKCKTVLKYYGIENCTWLRWQKKDLLHLKYTTVISVIALLSLLLSLLFHMINIYVQCGSLFSFMSVYCRDSSRKEAISESVHLENAWKVLEFDLGKGVGTLSKQWSCAALSWKHFGF